MAYYGNVAERKKRNQTSKPPAKKQPPKKSLGFVFWLVFIAVIAGLFIINREIITRNIQSTGFLDRLLTREPSVVENLPEMIPEDIDVSPSEHPPVAVIPPVNNLPRTPVETIPPASQPPETSAPENPPAENPAEIRRDRNLYFVKLDNDGTIVRTSVFRSLPVSNSPMMDVLNVLLQGPNADEKKKGVESLIPEGTTILSAAVRGSTAYISFSEDFQFNIYGVEGYAAQLRQIVWTVTEFENIKDVQILLEGRRIDYLGEGIWIGSPLSRDML